jgi:outer membrane receptor protein involved in Fe transport
VPLNPFGKAASKEALAYAFGDLTEHNDIRNDSFDLTLSGPIWRGFGAGPVQSAIGMTYTVNQLVNYAGDTPDYIRADYQAQYGNTFGGRTRSYEAFGEVQVPLLIDKPFVRSLGVGASIRMTHDRNRGTDGTSGVGGYQKSTSWRLSGSYEPTNWMSFRGTYSRDMRAASFRELYYSQTRGGGLTQVCNPWVDGTSCVFGSDDVTMLIGGSPNVNPEISKNLTVGLVLRPSFEGALRGLNFSVDLYQMSLGGGQTLTGPQETIADCYNNIPEACAMMGFDPEPRSGYSVSPELLAKSNIAWVQTQYVNREKQVQRGLDFAITHYLNLESLLNWRGTVSVRLSSTYVLAVLAPTGSTTGASTVQRAGVLGGGGFLPNYQSGPRLRGTLTLGYNVGAFNGTLNARYTHKGIIYAGRLDPSDPGYLNALNSTSSTTYGTTVDDNHTPSYVQTDLNLSYNITVPKLERANLFLNVTNLFDMRPPWTGGSFGGSGVGGTNGMYFDTMGRTYRFGIRTQF